VRFNSISRTVLSFSLDDCQRVKFAIELFTTEQHQTGSLLFGKSRFLEL